MTRKIKLFEGASSENEKETKFMDTVELGREMTPEDAIEALRSFLNTSRDAVLDSFINLKSSMKGDDLDKVVFKSITVSGNDIISMVGINSDGRKIWDHRINPYNGNPLPRSG